MEKQTIWVVGDDSRQQVLARLLTRDGHDVYTYSPAAGEEATGIEDADCIVLPVGMEVEATSNLLGRLRPGQLALGGGLREEAVGRARARGVIVKDYMAREELAVANAVPTAEGAVQIAMEELPITVHGARVLVVGFGRVGRMCAQRFAALGAEVTVTARTGAQLAWARAMGCDAVALEMFAGQLGACDLVINTVPAPVLGQTELERMGEGCLVLDLASAPGGVDQRIAAELGRRVIHALALPAKVAPLTAGAALRDTIEQMLREAQVERPERKHT